MLTHLSKHERQLKKTFRRLLAEYSAVLLDKLLRNERKYHFGWAWRSSDWEADCQADLVKHVSKGDPRDTGIYSFFMWLHKWRTAAPGTTLLLVGPVDLSSARSPWQRPEVDGYPTPGKDVWVANVSGDAGQHKTVSTDYWTGQEWNASLEDQVVAWREKVTPAFPTHLLRANFSFNFELPITVPGVAKMIDLTRAYADEQATAAKLAALGQPPLPHSVAITPDSLRRGGGTKDWFDSAKQPEEWT